ncbi:hypothetical protein PSTG_04729 [Puccinia striiformis f. sp. tritici PST-78]|uniref:Uncharacterized protein n=1 Tax=Puccinia striiformis f. sp. tritici PST-78 TaxID=1165861 RepID=A0A0L0VSB8_9BASI|nr:hypothetical protein PSTG_04729 [Puccinia striiformis f. sp. tritici PST-78]
MGFRKYSPDLKWAAVRARLDRKNLAKINLSLGATISRNSLSRWTGLYERTQAVVCNPNTYPTRGHKSGVCLEAVQRTQGWAEVGDQTPRVERERSTHHFNIIPAISTSGLVAHMVQEETVERNDFEFYLQQILVTGQWVNKPKFHHLLHLSESILCFGPASLFSTEKFESFNGVMRNASIHSIRQSPGRDIAITFDNHYSLRSLLSGGIIYNSSTQTFSRGSDEVINMFLHNPVIRKSLGYDLYASNPLSPNDYPFTKKDKAIEEEQLPVPQQLIDHCSSQNIKRGYRILQVLFYKA